MAIAESIRWTVLLFLTLSECALAVETGELKSRRERAAHAFSDGILLVRGNSALDFTADGFRQDPVFLYLTGLENTAGAILMIDGRSRESWLFLPTRPLFSQAFPPEGLPESDGVKRSGIEHVLDWSELEGALGTRAATETTIHFINPLSSQPELPPNLAPSGSPAPLWVMAIAQKWPQFQIKEAGDRVRALLDVRGPSEMKSVRAAASATTHALLAGMRAIRPGMSQRTVELAVLDACWKAGAHGVAFWPWAMAGPNAVFPRPFASSTRYDHLDAAMKAGDLVRLDVGCESDHYGGDLGRTIPVSGHYSPEQRELWTIFVAAYHAAVKSLRAGVSVDSVFQVWSGELLRQRANARTILARQAIDDWSKREKVPYWQLHTMNLLTGRVSDPLVAGSTIALEPTATVAGQGFFIEDLFLITTKGAELLTPGVPYSAAEIEAAMGTVGTKLPSARRE